MSTQSHTSQSITSESYQEVSVEILNMQQLGQNFLLNMEAIRSTYRSISSVSASYRQDMRENSKATSELASSAKKSSSILGEFRTSLKSMAIKWAINKALELISTGFDNLVHSAEHCKERVDELMSSYSSALTEANNNAKTAESLASRYEELSKGVNNLGQNVSLTSEEFTEYHNIVNQIAGMFPELIQGYTSEGDAILSLKGNVDQLRDAYKDAQQEAYNMLLTGEDASGNDILQNWKNLQDTSIWSKLFDFGAADIGGGISMQDAIDQLQAFSEMKAETYRNALKTVNYGGPGELESLTDMERRIGNSSYLYKELGIDENSTDEEIETAKRHAKALIQTYQAEIDSALNNVELLANAYLVTDETYAAMDEQSKNAASIIVNNLNSSVANGFKNQTDIAEYVQTIIDFIKDNPRFGHVLEDLLAVPSDDQTLREFTEEYQRTFEIAKTYCEQNGIEIPIVFSENDYINAYQALQDSIRQITNEDLYSKITQSAQDPLLLGIGSGAINALSSENEVYAELSEYTKNFTAVQAEIWADATLGAHNAEEAIRRYEARLKELAASPLSISETVDHLNTQLKPALDSLQSAYANIFSLDESGTKQFSPENVGVDTYESIKSALGGLNRIDGINVPYSAYEQFVSVLSDTSSTAEDVQNQFDRLATSMIYATDCTNMSAETYDLLVQSLTDLGVTNAADILSQLNELQQDLIDQGYNIVTVTAKEAAQLIENGEVSLETAEYLRQYLLQKEMAQNPLNTLADISALESLCNTLGVTGELYECVVNLKRAFAAKEGGAVSAGLDESIENLQDRIAALSSGEANLGFHFGDLSKRSSAGQGASRSTTETFDWIEQAIENVEKEIKNLDETANAAYSSLSQKNEALAGEIGKISEAIDLQQQAYDAYMQKAESVGLSDYYKDLVQNGAVSMEEIADDTLRQQINEYQKWYDKAQSALDSIRSLKNDQKDLYVSAYELQTADLKDRLDNNAITEKQYLDELKSAYTQFYANLTEYAQQYHEAVLDYLAQEKDYLNNVAGSVPYLLDTEIDQIRADASMQEESLKQQIELLNDRKKPLQDELNALEDKARQENLILNLQKAQYDLARAENQRTTLIFTEENGMVYTSDTSAVKAAKKNVDDARLEIQKQSIRDQIDLLDEEIDRYNDLIDQINAAADNQINALEQIKNKWQEVIDRQEYAKNISLLTGEFGAGAIEMILSGNDDALLAQWKQNYISTLAEIDMESQGYIGSLTEQMASLYGVDLSPWQEQFQGVTDSVNNMADALNETALAIGIGAASGQTTPDSGTSGNAAAPSADSESLEQAVKRETATAMSSFDQHAEKLTNEVIPAIRSATEEMNQLNAAADLDIEKTITITYHTTGDTPLPDGTPGGAPHAEGTAKVTGDWGVRRAGTALVGELGQEIIVSSDGTWRTVGDHGAEFVNLQENDIIFNHLQTQELLRRGTLSKPPHQSAASLSPVTAVPIGTQTDTEGSMTPSREFSAPESSALHPVQPGDRAWELQEKVQPLLADLDKTLDILADNAMSEHSRRMEQMLTKLNESNVVNHSNVQPNIHVDGITITCPGVTSKEVMREVSAALEETFRGFHNYADQQSRIR